MNRLTIDKFPPLSYACEEAINTLCVNLTFSGENVRKIMITSSHASEGKSFLTMNIMRTLAKLGKSVAIVDADLRKSMIRVNYGIRFEDEKHTEGLAHLLAGKVDIEQVIYQTNIPGAYMVPIGRTVSNPLSLLNSNRLNELLDFLTQNVDYVLVDAPPVGTVIDAAQIAKYCDGTLLAVSYDRVHRRELLESKEQLEQTGCPILGTVLNMVERDNYLSKKYYYKSYYSNYEYTSQKQQDEAAKAKAAKK